MKSIRQIKRYLKHKSLIHRYKAAITDGEHQYPYLRYMIADERCHEAVGMGIKGCDELIRWQEIRERYRSLIIKLRPRCNEFYSY